MTAVGLAVGLAFSGQGAGAQGVESLQARAERLADELERLEQRSSQLNEQYLEVSEELEEVRAERRENEAAVEAASERIEATRAEAAGYLVEAYVGAGAHEQTLAAASSDPNDAVNSQVLLEIIRGDRELLADDIAAGRRDLEDRADDLAETDARLEATEAEQRRVVEELEASIDEQSGLLDSANEELQDAIEAERQRREAEAQARAEAEARAAAAAQARAAEAESTRRAAARSTSTTAAPSSSAPSRGTAPAAPAPAPSAAPAPAPAPPPPPAPASPPRSGAAGAIAAAKSQIGLAYRWGGTSPSTGFDCSGLTSWAWAQVGVTIPRTSRAQLAASQRISESQLQPGDLVFYGNPVHHVGMYVGGGQMIHSPRTGSTVHITGIHRGFGGAPRFGRVG